MPRGTGRDGTGIWLIFSQRRQGFFRRAVSTTLSLAEMNSRISLTSSPISRRGPPRWGQSSPRSSTIRSRGVTDYLRDVRPAERTQFERRFETPPGKQAQVDFAEFQTVFTDEPGIARKVWLFSMVLGHSRWLWGRDCSSQNLQTVLRCHIKAFATLGGVPSEVLYDRMKTAVIGEDAN